MEPVDQSMESKRLAFLAMVFARSHRMLYRAQFVEEVGKEVGFSAAEARTFAESLRHRGLLRMLSGLSARGPLMEITPEGIHRVRASIAAGARAGGAAE
jgi:hypothetical protein